MPELDSLAVADVILLGACLLFGVLGLFKGFVWQAIRTLGFVAALMVAGAWYEPTGAWLAERLPFLPGGMVADVAGAIVLFVGTFLLATFLASLARGTLKAMRLGVVDRLLGLAWGVLFGLLLVTVGYLVWANMGWSDASVRAHLDDAMSRPLLTKVLEVGDPFVPPRWRERWPY